MQAGKFRCIPEVNLFNSSNLHQSVSVASFQISTDFICASSTCVSILIYVQRSWSFKGFTIFSWNFKLEYKLWNTITSFMYDSQLQKRILSFLQIRFVLLFLGIYRELCLESVKNKYECEIQAACQHWEVRGQVKIHLVQKQRILYLFSFFWSFKYVCNFRFLRCFA